MASELFDVSAKGSEDFDGYPCAERLANGELFMLFWGYGPSVDDYARAAAKSMFANELRDWL